MRLSQLPATRDLLQSTDRARIGGPRPGENTMAEKITIEDADGTWVVRAGGAVIGESAAALRLIEDGHDDVIYFPRGDVAMAFLDASDTTTECPHKGTASYFSIQTKSVTLKDAAWSYEQPKAGVGRIERCLAFQGDTVTVEQV